MDRSDIRSATADSCGRRQVLIAPGAPLETYRNGPRDASHSRSERRGRKSTNTVLARPHNNDMNGGHRGDQAQDENNAC